LSWAFTMGLWFSPWDYLKGPPRIMSFARIARCIVQASRHKLANGPNMIGEPERHGRRFVSA